MKGTAGSIVAAAFCCGRHCSGLLELIIRWRHVPPGGRRLFKFFYQSAPENNLYYLKFTR
jgi:hypothetical protein